MPDLFGITKYTLTLLYDRSHNSYIKFLSISIDNFNMDMQEIERGGGGAFDSATSWSLGRLFNLSLEF